MNKHFSYIAGTNAKWCSHFGRQFGGFLKIKNTLYNTAITLLHICPNLKAYVHIKTCTWMLIAVLFIIAKIWKQPG